MILKQALPCYLEFTAFSHMQWISLHRHPESLAQSNRCEKCSLAVVIPSNESGRIFLARNVYVVPYYYSRHQAFTRFTTTLLVAQSNLGTLWANFFKAK